MTSMDAVQPERDGILIVVSAPSGAGKTTLCRHLIDNFPDIRQSVSFTTRLPRHDEQDGKDYHFVDRATFDRMVSEGAFAEWAEVHGNCYGTLLKSLQEALTAGQDILLDIDCQGAAQLREALPQSLFIFVVPPSLAELERRLRFRKTDSDEVIARRLVNAREEIQAATWYNYVLVNRDLATSQHDFSAIVQAERCRTERYKKSPAEWFGLDDV